MFHDRRDAGARLATALERMVDTPALVLGIPRGGVIVALPVAVALGAPLDVIVPRKLGAPHNAELGIGAVAPGVLIVDDHLARMLGVPEGYIEEEAAAQESEIQRRVAAYRGERPPLDLTDRTVVVIDDGIATGVTAIAALRSARKAGASRVIFAAPVGPAGIEQVLVQECDSCVVLETPTAFGAVGEWYERFAQVSDDEVRAALDAA